MNDENRPSFGEAKAALTDQRETTRSTGTKRDGNHETIAHSKIIAAVE